MTRRVIGLGGYARSGKDTVAARLVARHGFTRVAFADQLKAVALDVDPIVDTPPGPDRLSSVVDDMGWEDAKSIPEVRRTLQRLGVAVRRVDPDFWVRAAVDVIDGIAGDVVVTDVRFPNEVDVIRYGPTLVPAYSERETSTWGADGTFVRVVRPGTGPANGHESETGLDAVRADIVLENRGTVDDLNALVDAVLA